MPQVRVARRHEGVSGRAMAVVHAQQAAVIQRTIRELARVLEEWLRGLTSVFCRDPSSGASILALGRAGARHGTRTPCGGASRRFASPGTSMLPPPRPPRTSMNTSGIMGGRSIRTVSEGSVAGGNERVAGVSSLSLETQISRVRLAALSKRRPLLAPNRSSAEGSLIDAIDPWDGAGCAGAGAVDPRVCYVELLSRTGGVTGRWVDTGKCGDCQ